LPAASVAVARYVVDVLVGAVTLMPGDANVAAVPVTLLPVQFEVVYRATVDPPSAVPISLTLAVFEGDAGVDELITGAAGAAESSVYVVLADEQPDGPFVFEAVA